MTIPLLSPLITPYSPEWWVSVLHQQLQARLPELERYQKYYDGEQDATWVPQERLEEFRTILDISRANICGLVVDSTAERLAVEGFRLGPSEQNADAETWRIWQANGLDSSFDQGILEALIGGRSYLLDAPNPADERTPQIFVEHATQAIVAFAPGTNRRERLAGLKVWQDEWTSRQFATLYVASYVFKFQTWAHGDPAPSTLYGQWIPRMVGGETWPAKNPLGEVPLYEIPNRPRLLKGGVSELKDVLSIQDRIYKTIAERMKVQDSSAFPRLWATGYPTEDEDGQPLEPIASGPDRMLTTDVKETKFGQFDAATLDPFSAAKREDFRDAASRTRTPAQYLLGDLSNVNGETLKASESGLVSKCFQAQRYMSDPLEDAIRGARKLAGLPAGSGASMETMWRDPQYRTEGERADASVKLVTTDIVSRRQARLDLGYSVAEIDRMEQEIAAEGLNATLDRILRPVNDAAVGS